MESEDEVPRVFIDTNVWFSAFYSSKICEKLLKAHIDGRIKAVISRQVLNELVRNITTKIPQALPILEKFLKNAPPLIVADAKNIPSNLKDLVDRKDAGIFASYLSSRIPMFVTGNIKDFNTKKILKRYKIFVLTPKEALEKLKL